MKDTYQKPAAEIRKYTDSQIQYKREKGLCFRCDDKWSPGHRCKQKEINVVIIADEIEGINSEQGSEEANEGVADLEMAELKGTVEVSLQSVAGLSSNKTMKLKGLIEQCEVVILIDPGATHNFISQVLVDKLKLPIVKTSQYGVTMGNGDSMRNEGICKNVHLHLQGVEIFDDFLPLKLGSADVILGLQWLATLGMQADRVSLFIIL